MGESYNVAAVDSIRTYYAEHPEAEKTINIPLLAISTWSSYQYAQPPYWNALHDRYLGSYNPTMFGNYCQSYNINTVNEYDEFTGTEDNLREVNKKAVYAMTSYINQQFQMAPRYPTPRPASAYRSSTSSSTNTSSPNPTGGSTSRPIPRQAVHPQASTSTTTMAPTRRASTASCSRPCWLYAATTASRGATCSPCATTSWVDSAGTTCSCLPTRSSSSAPA